MEFLKNNLNSIKLKSRKHTKNIESVIAPVPEKVAILMSQHMGAACEPLVALGDNVCVGQRIGDSVEDISAPVHSSVSGKVSAIEEVALPWAGNSKVVIIESDQQQKLSDLIKAPLVNNREEFIAAIRNSGLVGLGGAGFPTHVKLNPPNPECVDTLLINAAECEPMITSDYRTMMEQAEDVLQGIDYVLRYLEIPRCVIGIEEDNAEAIRKMQEFTAGDARVSVKKLRARYPQGAEKVLIFETLKRVVKEGSIPAQEGVIVFNVSTIAFIGQYMRDGVPLISRRITVDGGAVKEPKNLIAYIGTPVQDIIELCGGYKEEVKKILMGGPMMGIALADDSFPIVKQNNAILALTGAQSIEHKESACIRCGRCVRACPVNLMPLYLNNAFQQENMDDLVKYKVNLCIECGCCSYVCPARIELAQVNRMAKTKINKSNGIKILET